MVRLTDRGKVVVTREPIHWDHRRDAVLAETPAGT